MATAATEGGNRSAFLIGSCFQRKAGSRAVARKSRDGTTDNLRGVIADLHNMSRMLTDVAKIDIYESWSQRRDDSKRKLMESMRAFFSQEGKEKFVIYYSGHGTTQGDWALNDDALNDGHEGRITLQDIIGLWDEIIKTKASKYALMIIADCCHSGAWVDKLDSLKRGDIAMQAACQADRGCTDADDGGHFTNRYIVGVKNCTVLHVSISLSNDLTLRLIKAAYYSIRFRYQPVHTNTRVLILPLFQSFTQATFLAHWII